MQDALLAYTEHRSGKKALVAGLIQNGKYREALKRWGQSSEAVSASEVNPPGIIYQ